MSELIIVACISAVGAVLASLVQIGRKENKADHADVIIGITRIETKIDGHLSDHTNKDARE